MTNDNNRNLPHFILVAAAKSGTTSLARYLGEHPDLYMPPHQVNFFHNDEEYPKGADAYAQRFKDAPPNTKIGAHNPFYYAHAPVPGRMQELLPEVKLIWLLRNPLTRTYSHYWFNVTRGTERVPFSDIFTHDRWPHNYMRKSEYSDFIEHWLKFFKREQMHFVLSENLKTKKEETLTSICRFLDIDDQYQFQNLTTNARETTLPRNIHLHRWLLTNRMKWGNGFKFVADRIIRLNQASAPGYPPIPENEREKLAHHFASKNAKLADLTGLDLSAWT